MKFVEDPGKILLRQAYSGVGHLERDLAFFGYALDENGYPTAFGKFERIVD
jgi:hypothetical protein